MEKFKQRVHIVWKKFMMFWKELGNLFTNLLCPVLSILAAGCELLQLPRSVIGSIKKAEAWCFNACGTKKVIDDMLEKTDEVIDNLEKGED